MELRDYGDHDACALREAISAGEATATEVTTAAIDAAEALNGRLNAIIHPRYERALADAAAVDQSKAGGLLAGVPVVVKDLDGLLAGEPYHAGTQLLRDAGYVSPTSSVAIGRLVDAGAIVVGKTNTPELGLVPSTEPVSTGPAHNPWDLDRSPAGSSGGSAAAVAAGIAPLGHAGDGGGSIRLPASVCGLVGLKPSTGLVPTYPDILPWGGLVARLGVTRTVRDTALLLDVMAGADPLECPQVVGTQRGSWRDTAAQDPGSLRIGVTVASPDGGQVDPRIVTIVEQTAASLAELGHRVDATAPPGFAEGTLAGEVTGDMLTVYPVWVRDAVTGLEALAGRAATEADVEAHTWALMAMGDGVSGPAYLGAYQRMMHRGRALREWFAGNVDVLVLPTISEVPWLLGGFAPQEGNPLAGVFRSSELISFQSPFNISGQPAISLPLGMADGLPIGVQLVAAWGREDLLLQLATQLEAAHPWADRHAPVSVWE